MKSRTLFFLVLLFVLAACASPGTVVTEPPVIVTEEPTSEPTPTGPFSLEWLTALPPKTILLQQDYEPTFFRMEAQYPFGREIVFVLYADGTLIYTDEGEMYDQLRIKSVQLSPEETLGLVQQVMDAGFQHLNSHTDFCFDQENGEQLCLMDAAVTVLRVIQPDSSLREVKIYGEFANDLSAFQTVTGLFYNYTHPNAQLYIPEYATLFLYEIAQSSEIVVQPWPLVPEILTGRVLTPENLHPVILSGQDLMTMLNSVPRNFGDFYFELDGTYYGAYLVPWALDKDYTNEIETAFPIDPVPFSNPEVTPEG